MAPLDITRVLTAIAIVVVIAGFIVSLFFDGPVADTFSEYAWWVWIRMPRLFGV